MRTLSKVSSRYSARTTLVMGFSIVVVLSVSAALVTWPGSSVPGVVAVLGFALVVTVFVQVRRALRRASALIDTILREEVGPDPAAEDGSG